MSNDPDIIARLDALPWMPRRPSRAVAKPLAARKGNGRTVSDNPVLQELRARFPKLVKEHPPHGGKALHVAIATELRHLYTAYHANLQGVAENRIALSNSLGYPTPGSEIKNGRADKMVRYLEAATFTVQAVPRPGGLASGLCGCGGPLDGSDRTYCKACKTKHNRIVKQRRKAATPPASGQPGRRDTVPEHIPKPAGHNHRKVADPAPTPYAERPLTRVMTDGGQRMVIIDFRMTSSPDYGLTDAKLLVLAGDLPSGFNALDAGRFNNAYGKTTDVAYAADTTHGAVVWVTQANATAGYPSVQARQALRLSADIGELIEPTSPRAAKYAREKFLEAATVIAGCTDMTFLADSYQLSVEIDRELSPAEPVSVDVLIDKDTIRPTTADGWDIARSTLRNNGNKHEMIPKAIEAGALTERRTAA